MSAANVFTEGNIGIQLLTSCKSPIGLQIGPATAVFLSSTRLCCCLMDMLGMLD